MEPGAFKLWVNWTQVVQPHLAAEQQLRGDVHPPVPPVDIHGVAVQVDPFDNKGFQTTISHYRFKG